MRRGTAFFHQVVTQTLNNRCGRFTPLLALPKVKAGDTVAHRRVHGFRVQAEVDGRQQVIIEAGVRRDTTQPGLYGLAQCFGCG